MREEVADICAALALGCALLVHLGLGTEAARLDVLYRRVETRLGACQPEEAAGASTSSSGS